jgi:hypothetical protein
MQNNIFTNKDLYEYHFNIEHKERRMQDFMNIYNVLKSHLEPKTKAKIDENKLQKYINLYKDENKEFIKNILHLIIHIDYDKFCSDTFEQLEKLNNNIKNKKYIYILGVNNQNGSSNTDYNIYKSNLWMFMLIFDKLETKPVDILLNIKIAIQLYGDDVEYLIVDDCSYSGTQIIQKVLYNDASETLYKYPNSYLIKNNVYKKTIFKPIQKHNIKVHLFIPYLSYIAWIKINELNLLTCFDIIRYEKYILNELGTLLSSEDCNKLNTFYSYFYGDYNALNLIPIFFDHKIADGLSTIELILTKGRVLDDPKSHLIFINPCDELYDNLTPADLIMPLYCPIPPYQLFKKILEEQL